VSQPYYIPVAAGPTPAFASAGYAMQIFDLTLNQNAIASQSGFTQGNILIFAIRQDSAGGWTFAWPAEFENAPEIDAGAGGVSVAIFVADDAGKFYPLSPGTRSS
jgi:hypothetical protein